MSGTGALACHVPVSGMAPVRGGVRVSRLTAAEQARREQVRLAAELIELCRKETR